MHTRVILVAEVYHKREGEHKWKQKQDGECSLQDMSMGFSQTKTIWTPFLHAVGYANKGRGAPTDNVFLPQPKIIKEQGEKTFLEVRLSEQGSCCSPSKLCMCCCFEPPASCRLSPFSYCSMVLFSAWLSWTRPLHQSIPCEHLPHSCCCFSSAADHVFTAVPFSSKGPWLCSGENGKRDDQWGSGDTEPTMVDADVFPEQRKMAKFQSGALAFPAETMCPVMMWVTQNNNLVTPTQC